jgi:hypothetical protein
MSTSPTVSVPDPAGNFALLAASQAALRSRTRSGHIPPAPRFKFANRFKNYVERGR